LLPNPIILAFDTSAAHCAVALYLGGEIVSEHIEPMTKGQAERLFPLCEEVLSAAGITWTELDAIGVCVGPGNFTGVRVGVSAARGLALSLAKPAIGISKLEAMGLDCVGEATVVMDARRKRAYVQKFIDGKAQGAPILTPIEDLNTAIPVIMSDDDPLIELFADRRAPVMTLPNAVIRIAARKINDDNPRPAPLYLQDAGAALPSDPAPVILP
jgi:tRNA threonylcarbamoyl adenosine modification protein YeaZ